MSNHGRAVKVAIFGHYGNKNLGDEAIIEAAINNTRRLLPNSEVVCMSINPFDSAERHKVAAFPIRYRADYFNQATPSAPATTAPVSGTPASQPSAQKSLKQTIKSLPLIGFGIRAMLHLKHLASKVAKELVLLSKGKAFLKDVDLLMITGSNQFLDNFGGAWGFPFTLLKWTLLAKLTGTKVAFISIGAGPLNLPLSYKMLSIALKKADYVSYRDEGSKELIESQIPINAPVFPDIAHGLCYQSQAESPSEKTKLTIAVNPMPVYDKRYWHHPDESKYNSYVNKVTQLCQQILQDGHALTLFSTQSKDENVIDDIVENLNNISELAKHQSNIHVAKHSQVSELMGLIDNSDIVVATRFHATVLPMQVGKPTLGICYYRKAAELLDEFGLSEYHVDIDNFDAETLIGKYQSLVKHRLEVAPNIARHHDGYREALEQQYKTVFSLVTSD